MAANTLPSGIGDLFNLAERMNDALGIYGPWLLKGALEQDEFSGYLTTAREAESAFALARARKAAAGRNFTMADENLTSWLAKARLVVMLAYGAKWSESWIAAGFTHRGTNVPKRIAARMELSRRLASFFAAHPEYEVAFANVTAEHADALQKEIVAAQKEVQLAKSEAAAKKRARDKAVKKLRREMHGAVLLLSVALSKSDPRWLAFGLKIPKPDAAPNVRGHHPAVPLAPPVETDFRSAGELPPFETAVA